jgi:hypothetical protein
MSNVSDEKLGSQETETPTKKLACNWLIRFLWMRKQMAEARAKTFDASKPGFAWYDLARQFCDDGVTIEEHSSATVALLACAAIGLLVRAHLARAGLQTGTGPLADSDWENARTVQTIAEAWSQLTPAQASTLTAMLGPDRDATMARMTKSERISFATSMHRLVIRLAAPLDFEANRLKYALLARWLRIAALGLVLSVVLAFAGSWMAIRFAKPNLARGSKVTVSSRYPGAGDNPDLLVDGNRENLGFHTDAGGQQWVVIDLGATRSFDKVVVYNRAEGQHARAVPLRLEVSDDNRNYTLLRERKETFDKWTAKGLHAKGRYLRLQNTPPKYFHLSEVEIY